MGTTPFCAADYLTDKADIVAAVRYSAELEAEVERLRAALRYVEAHSNDPQVVAQVRATLDN